MDTATYKAVTMDGEEHSGLDQPTIKQWYLAKRLRPDSFVLSPEIGEWKLLKSVFDPAAWDAEERATRGRGPNASVHNGVSSPEQFYPLPYPNSQESHYKSQEPYYFDRDNERGLRAAGILLIINAALSLASLAIVVVASPTDSSVSSVWGFNILLDVIVGFKLLRSDNFRKWKRIALVRVGLGALLIGVGLILVGPNEKFKLLGLLQLVFASSFYILLLGEASRARVVTGVLTFVLSTCAMFGVLSLGNLSGGATSKREILKYALPTRSFSDGPSGVNIELPDGWVLLPNDNPVVRQTEANMIAVHPDSDSYATLVILKVRGGRSLDTALSLVVTEQRKSKANLVEVERLNSLFGRLDGRKVVMTWQDRGLEFKGWVTVARNGSYYIFLNEWCASETYSKSGPQFAALENAATADEPVPDPPDPIKAIRGQPNRDTY